MCVINGKGHVSYGNIVWYIEWSNSVTPLLYVFQQYGWTERYLAHSSDQVVDFVLTVTKVTTLDKVIGDTSVTTIWCGEFESPQEVVGAFEIRSNGEDLVDQILDGLETNVADILLNNSIVVQSNALTIDLTMTALVDKLADGLEVGVTPGNVWLLVGWRE